VDVKKKILLIDDEEDFCFFVKGNLEKTRKYRVITATEGRKGIDLARSQKPDLILLDIVMPEVSGSEVAEVLSKDPRTKDLPLIFLTAVVTEEEMGVNVIKEIGGQNFIAKTVGTERIISFIKEVLERQTL